MDTPPLTPDFTTRPPGVFHAAHGSAHSWPEDFGGENGNYQNACVTCKTRQRDGTENKSDFHLHNPTVGL